MRVTDLTWLVAVADAGHITAAAAGLGVPQPTVSRALARVEHELGVAVFERRPDGVAVTAVGRVVVQAARDLVGRYERLTDEIDTQLSPDRGVVRLAFLDSIASSLVPRLLGAFHRTAPRVRLELTQEPNHRMVRDLADGAVDLAITSPRPDAGPWLPITTERLMLVVPPGHRLRTRRRVDLAELADDDLVTTPPGYGHRRLVDALLDAAGIAPSISFESQDLATIEGLVAAGLGVAVLPEAFAGASGSVGIAVRNPGARREIGLTWSPTRALPPPAARFRDVVAESGPWD